MCGQIDAKAAKVIQIEDIDIDLQGSYKYLRIPQANTNYDKDAARSATAKYLQKVRQLQTAER